MNTISVILILIIINKGAGKGAVKEKGVTMTIAKGLRIVRHHQGHNSGSRVKMMQIHLLKICTIAHCLICYRLDHNTTRFS